MYCIAPRILSVPDIPPGVGNIVILDITCVENLTDPLGRKCNTITQDNAETICSHINDIGIDCIGSTVQGQGKVKYFNTLLHNYLH